MRVDFRIRVNYFYALLLILGTTQAALARKLHYNLPERGFTSWMPARSWEEALLSGNGTIGTMVMGRPHNGAKENL